ncbi:MAG TPA: ABC transporter substrate-binding protein [Longimicrobium sp.]|jgi:branched-chain amino acid transport system substrate-binding protein
MKIRGPFLLFCALALAGCGRGGGGQDVVIGVAGPLARPNGRSMKLAAEMAVAEINAAGGVDGRDLRIEWGDDEADAGKAIDVARRLRANPEVVAVVGHVNSAASREAAKIYNAVDNDSVEGDPVVEVSPASSAPELSQAGEWTFRVTPTDLEFAPKLADWALGRLGSRRAAVLYANDAYGQGVKEGFLASFRRGGGTVVSADPYLPAMFTADDALDPFLRRALSRGADALVIGGQAAEGTKIIAAARRLGYTGPILGSDGLTGVKDAGAVAEGVFISSAFLPDRPNERTQKFVGDYQRRFGELPDHRGAMAYDVIYLLREAIRRVGTDRAAIRGYLARVGAEGGHPPFEGVSGTVRFDQNGDAVGKEVSVGVVRGGRLVTAAR